MHDEVDPVVSIDAAPSVAASWLRGSPVVTNLEPLRPRLHDIKRLVERLVAGDVLTAPINEIPEVAENPQIRHNRMIVTTAESGILRSLDGGEVVADYLAVSLNSNLRTIRQKLSSSSGEVDTAVWAGLVAVTGMLSTGYAVAVLTALWIILGLSLAFVLIYVISFTRETQARQRAQELLRELERDGSLVRGEIRPGGAALHQA